MLEIDDQQVKNVKLTVIFLCCFKSVKFQTNHSISSRVFFQSGKYTEAEKWVQIIYNKNKQNYSTLLV